MVFLKKQRSGFTLMEVLCVMGIIGILVGILLPMVSAARKSGLKTRTKTQFYQYIFGLEAYFHEYGSYPNFFYENGCIELREWGEEFVKALSGHGKYPEFAELTGEERQRLNPKGIVFYRFGESEFNDEGMLVDAFGNPDICICVDMKGLGLLKVGGIRIAEKIGIYSQKNYERGYEDVQSWK